MERVTISVSVGEGKPITQTLTALPGGRIMLETDLQGSHPVKPQDALILRAALMILADGPGGRP